VDLAREELTRFWRINMKRIVVLISLAMLLAITSAGQDPPTLPIVVKVSGLACSNGVFGAGSFPVEAWNFGATFTPSTGGGGGKTMVQNLLVEKLFDDCSPALFGATVNGRGFSSLTLTQSEKDKEGREVALLTVTLDHVLLVSYQISGAQTSAKVTESLSFSFERICIKGANSGAEVCYDTRRPPPG